MIEIIRSYVIPAAYDVLPPAMRSAQATALLLAIGLQESRFTARRQVAGPAKSFWMFETAGVWGVLTHPKTEGPIRTALLRLCYHEPFESAPLQLAIEHNDVLAAAFARCLLWSLPTALPEPLETAKSWNTYLSAWKPGRPRRETWDANYLASWDRVIDQPKNA